MACRAASFAANLLPSALECHRAIAEVSVDERSQLSVRSFWVALRKLHRGGRGVAVKPLVADAGCGISATAVTNQGQTEARIRFQ